MAAPRQKSLDCAWGEAARQEVYLLVAQLDESTYSFQQ